MEQLIPIASKLQDVIGAVGQSTNLDLPQIVVVGGQSSGKSSVLESLVGRSFLPRGTGIVTRRPLILQMYHTPGHDKENSNKNPSGDESESHEEWGEFLHKPGLKFYDFSKIRTEIGSETERLTGKNKGVDMEPIHLKIHSPYVLSLTLVDLPGIAKVPVGDQPANIEQQIREMCVKYISNPNAIILAVTPANIDLANSDAIQLAMQVDPNGTRTVGVLTKLDLMDPGTDCADILMNQVVPLRRGYVAVVNRGQKDIDTDKTIRDGLQKEEQFFKKHPVYSRDRNLLSKCGTSRLGKALNSMLMHHIRDCLPDLKARITNMLADVQQEVDALGSGPPVNNRSTRGAAVLKLLSKFSNNFGALLDGKGCKAGKFAPELEGGARISYIFTDVFAEALVGVGAFDGTTDEEVRMTIRNANGTRPALFVPEMAFDILVRRQITRLETPGVQCVDLVYEELQRIALQSQPTELTRYPTLRDRMSEVVSNLLRRCLSPTQMMISNLVKIELAYINVSHPDFVTSNRAVGNLLKRHGAKDIIGEIQRKEQEEDEEPPRSAIDQVGATPLSSSSLNFADANETIEPATPEANKPNEASIMSFMFRSMGNDPPKTAKKKKKQEEPGGPPAIVHLQNLPENVQTVKTSRDQVEMDVIKSLVDSYFGIIRKNFIDMTPKVIMYMLVNHARETLQNELVTELYRDAEIGQLLQEAEDIAVRRQTCNEMKELLGRALDIVNEVRDFNTFK
jgi:dynamin 1-like protein